MYRVDIYLAQNTGSLSKDERRHGYIVSCEKNGQERTVEGYGEVFGTYHEATLRALSDAMDRLNQSCEVVVHTEDKFVLNMLTNNLAKWAANDFRNAKGEPVKHAELWEEIWTRTKGQIKRTEAGRHKYSESMETKMKGEETNV